MSIFEFLKETVEKILIGIFVTGGLAVAKKGASSLYGFVRRFFTTKSRKSIESPNVMDILHFTNIPMMVDTSTGRMIPDPTPWVRRSHLLP